MMLYLLILIILTSNLLLFSQLRKKFILFILTVIVYSIWGFMYDLDGLFLILMVSEFTIFLVLLMTYLQLYNNFSFLVKVQSKKYLWLPFVVILLNFTDSSAVSLHFISIYKSLSLNLSTDFFLLYYLLFDKITLITVFLILIISFFSLFFIILYFFLKLTKQSEFKIFKTQYFLRKQALSKQIVFKNSLYAFQN